MSPQRISYHIAADRMERAVTILERLGLGEEVRTVSWTDTSGRSCLRTLTSTGVILCKNPETLVVTTLFVATPGQVKRMYFGASCPSYIMNVVRKNQIRFKDIL